MVGIFNYHCRCDERHGTATFFDSQSYTLIVEGTETMLGSTEREFVRGINGHTLTLYKGTHTYSDPANYEVVWKKDGTVITGQTGTSLSLDGREIGTYTAEIKRKNTKDTDGCLGGNTTTTHTFNVREINESDRVNDTSFHMGLVEDVYLNASDNFASGIYRILAYETSTLHPYNGVMTGSLTLSYNGVSKTTEITGGHRQMDFNTTPNARYSAANILPDTCKKPGEMTIQYSFLPDDVTCKVASGELSIVVNPPKMPITLVKTTDTRAYTGSTLTDDELGAYFSFTPRNSSYTREYTFYDANGNKLTAQPTGLGTFSVMLAVTDKYGTVESEKVSVTIEKAKITPSITLDSSYSLAYDGTAKEPPITLTYQAGGKTITVPAAEYDAVYSNNILTSNSATQGQALVTVTDKTSGNYVFSELKKEFTITKATPVFTDVTTLCGQQETNTFTYGETITVKAKITPAEHADNADLLGLMYVTCGDVGLTPSRYAEYGWFSGTYNTILKHLPVGTHTLTLHYTGSHTHEPAETKVSVTIEPKELTIEEVSAENREYIPENSGVTVTSIKLSGITGYDATLVTPYDTVTASTSDPATVASPDADTYDAMTLASVALGGVHKDFYVLKQDQEASVTANPSVIISPKILYASNIAGDDALITLTPDSYYYTGDKKQPTVTVTYTEGDTTYTVPTEEYAVSYAGNVEASENAAVTLTDVEGGNYDISGAANFTILQSGTTYGDTLTIANGDGEETTAFTYGETIVVTAKPAPTGAAPATTFRMLRRTAPAANQMALFYGDVQISEAVDADSDGVYTMTYATTDKLLPVGDNTITAKYVGTSNMADYEETVTVTIAAKEVLPVSAEANSRIYDGTTDVVITALELDGILGEDDVQADLNSFIGALAHPNAGEHAAVMIPAHALLGDDAAFYTAPGGVAAIELTIAKADPIVVPVLTITEENDPKHRGIPLGQLPLSLGAGSTPGTIAWDASPSTQVEADVAYTWTYIPTDTVNYNTASGSMVLRVALPQTGDTSSLLLWTMLLAACAAGMAILRRRSRA